MRRVVPVLFVMVFLFQASICVAQNTSKITNPSIEFKDNKLVITYNILESTNLDRFHVRLEVTDSTGNQIDVSALEGDVGISVSGGNNKTIYWDLGADGIYIDADIYIQIYADEIPAQDQKMGGDIAKESKSFNRAGIVLQSIAFPGLGLSRVKGGPHWLKGVAGYGALAGSYALNRMAMASYEDYKSSESAEEASDFLNKSMQQDQISEILAYAAIGIWITDFVWTMVGTKDLKKGQSAHRSRVNIGTNYDAISKAPLLAVSYRF